MSLVGNITDKIKGTLPLAVAVSLIAHLVLLYLLAMTKPVKPIAMVEKPQQIIKATLSFIAKPKPEPKPEIVAVPEPVEPIELPEPIEPQPELVKSEPVKPQIKPASVTLQTTAPESVEAAKLLLRQVLPQAKTPQASFDPYAKMNQLIEAKNSRALENLSYSDSIVDDITIKSIHSSDDPVNKPLLETHAVVDPNNRVIKFGKGCAQIERGKDFNGFDKETWLSTSTTCGQGDANKKQFEQSMAKFVKPRR